MKSRIKFLTLSMFVVIVVTSCAPAATSVPAAPATSPAGAEVIVPATVTTTDRSTLPAPEATIVPPTQAVEAQAVATSRGPNLEATDPTTVNLASGQLQMVEFFRFT